MLVDTKARLALVLAFPGLVAALPSCRRHAPSAGSPTATAEDAGVVSSSTPRESRFYQLVTRYEDDVAGFEVVNGAPVLARCHAFRHLPADLVAAPPSDGGGADEVLLAPKWPFDCSLPFNVDHERIVTFSHGGGQLRSFDAASGNMAWLAYVPDDHPRPELSAFLTMRPQLVGDDVVFVSLPTQSRQELVAMRARTGEVAWKRPGVNWFAHDGATLFAVEREDAGTYALAALDPATGSVRWRVPSLLARGSVGLAVSVSEGEEDAPLAAGSGRIAVLTGRTVLLVSSDDGHTLGRISTDTLTDGGSAQPRGIVFTAGAFFLHGGSALVRLDPGDGHVVWSTPGAFGRPDGDSGNGRALFAPHVEVLANNGREQDGLVVGFDPATGVPEWSYSVAPHAEALREGVALQLSVHLHGDVLAVENRPAGEVALFRPGREPLEPHRKTLDLTVKNVSDPQHIDMRVGDRTITVPPDGHWRGEIVGRGRLQVVAGEHFPDTLEGATVEMDDGHPEAKLELTAYVMDQACKAD